MREPLSTFERKLRQFLVDKVTREKDELANEMVVKDYSDYRTRIGRLKAWGEALEECDAINEELSKQ